MRESDWVSWTLTVDGVKIMRHDEGGIVLNVLGIRFGFMYSLSGQRLLYQYSGLFFHSVISISMLNPLICRHVSAAIIGKVSIPTRALYRRSGLARKGKEREGAGLTALAPGLGMKAGGRWARLLSCKDLAWTFYSMKSL